MSERQTNWWVVIAICLLFPGTLRAQEVTFSQYRMAPLSLNPAEVAASPNWRAIAHYRHQQMAGDVGFRSTQFSLMRPLYWGNQRYAGVGLSVLDDRSAGPGWFRFQRVGLSVAYNVPLKRRQYLSLGVQTRFQSKRITLDGVRTGNQFRPGTGFDPAVGSGEGANGLQAAYFSVDAGGQWYAVDRHERTVAFAGLSLFQLNRPYDTFFTPADPLPVDLNAYGGWRLAEYGQGAVSPELRWQYQAGQHLLNVGVRLAYRLSEGYANAAAAPYLEVIPRYTINRNASLAVQWHQGDYTFGVSYDTDASFSTAENPLRSAFELVVAWHPIVHPKKKKGRPGKKVRRIPATVRTPSVASQPVVLDFRLPSVSQSVGPRKVVGSPYRGSLAVQSLVLTVEFGFDRSALTPLAKEALRGVAVFLQQHPDLNVTLTGHADGVGTPSANEQISWQRARAVRDHLLSKGISDQRIKIMGKGNQEPLYPNTSEALRAKNRRVEISYSPR
ncbi:MAG: PorP/SprF family type IX secretion system membrane protein [Tunicatimonas sp.]